MLVSWKEFTITELWVKYKDLFEWDYTVENWDKVLCFENWSLVVFWSKEEAEVEADYFWWVVVNHK